MQTLPIASILDWWNELTSPEQVFFGIAALATLVVALLGLGTLFGFFHDADFDGPDVDGDGISLFSIKPITGFFLAFGWIGGSVLTSGSSLLIACVAAVVAGGILMFAIVGIIKASHRLRSNGNIKKEDALGKVATVYVTIPPAPNTGGQVTVSLDSRTITLGAMQKGDTPISPEAKVRITEFIDPHTVRVEPV